MKNLVLNSLKVFTLAGCVFVMFSCGGDDKCSTCTMDGQTDMEICDEGGVGSGVAYDLAITTQEGLGYDCTEN